MAIIGSVLGLLAGREQRKARQLETTSLELQRAYERLERNVDQWKHAERLSAFGQLAAGLAHEIRTPLSAIDGALELLRSEKANEELRREMTDIALKESKRLNRLLTDLLEFARPRKPEFRQASLETVVASVARLLEPQTRKQSIDLRWEAVGKLPDVECDPEQIRQVVLNLCMNAIQATGPGGTIRISLARTDAGIETSVADNGPGLAPEISDRLFEPFLTTKPNGTGLGLAVAKQIAENHNGRLSIDSSGSRGATFRLALPLQQIERTV
jgi:signal transduction histidine kinase